MNLVVIDDNWFGESVGRGENDEEWQAVRVIK